MELLRENNFIADNTMALLASATFYEFNLNKFYQITQMFEIHGSGDVIPFT